MVLGGALLVMAGCAEDPRPNRRATAIDVAGTWREQAPEGAGASLHIDNEDGVNDVVATLTGRTVADAEAAALARVPSPGHRAALVATLVLGAGRDAVREETDGGENVSFDGGATTTVQVQGAPVPVTPSTPEARDAVLSWALRLDGDDDALAGTLAVLVSEIAPRPGDVDGAARVTTRDEIALRFVREEE
jgi:hypothetical protein